jgi:chemotaxis protein methyltransferase CheR
VQVTGEDLTTISRLVHDLCGLVLDSSKGYLIESRLSQIAEDAGCKSFTELAAKARNGHDRALRNSVIDAITTQETLFFRDAAPFDALRSRVLPDLIDHRANTPNARRLRIWSAACSTGQEPYSIAIAIRDTLPDADLWDVNILATDISNAAIRQASMGRYSTHEINRGLDPAKLNRYFEREGAFWRVKGEVRSMVAFAHRNLLDPFLDLGPFDVIFCRNVAIYFDAQTRRNLFLRLAERLTPDGCLFVGSSECLIDIGPQFIPHNHCRATYYMPRSEMPNRSPGLPSLAQPFAPVAPPAMPVFSG